MRQMIVFWIICMVVGGIMTLITAEDFKTAIKIWTLFGGFLGAMLIGLYLLGD